MELLEIMTLQEVSEKYNIPLKTLHSRLKLLEENIEYRKMGKGQSTLLSPGGISKIIQ